ncbi:MAG: hypothetical protein COW34_07725 [Armatimonadetes bacterium CG17_big_fil_post_rev_8_21_14_2_50_66_6]|nr:MAG: hypothetical protein COW34_07725 [Armatimonadetes bacterium CG17_big_fil_post_rev_8_21_14_2_50_66_6]
MSHFTTIRTELRDKEALKKALADLGYSEIEDGHNLPLYGYQGDRRSQTADLVIRRQHVGGASNDVGFALGPDGCYTAIISEFDLHSGFQWNQKRSKLTQRYAFHTIVDTAAQQGWNVAQQEQQQDGTIRVVVQRWR